jgi:glucosamine--fructose-6-phosphate aminotransferase (isomerizing)
MSRMLEEIRQQPDTLARTLSAELPRMARFRKVLEKRRPSLIVLVARGTSDNAAQFGRYLLEILTGIPVSLAAPSIFTLYNTPVSYNNPYSNALVVAISQSGESTDTNVVLERARQQGALTIGVTNEAKSSLASLAEFVFLVRAGQEKSVAATKTYTGQMLFFYLLAYALGAKLSLSDLERLPEHVLAALTLEKTTAALAQRYRFMERAVVVGRGLNYANAFEFALKMMETSYVVAERFSSADFLHGPIALVERGFPLFLFAPSGVTWPTMQEMLSKLAGLKAETLVISDRANPGARKTATRELIIPARLPELFSPIPYIIPAQLFSAALAVEKGFDPDQPRTLSKVTQTL